jgi:hypothetical protein
VDVWMGVGVSVSVGVGVRGRKAGLGRHRLSEKTDNVFVFACTSTNPPSVVAAWAQASAQPSASSTNASQQVMPREAHGPKHVQ